MPDWSSVIPMSPEMREAARLHEAARCAYAVGDDRLGDRFLADGIRISDGEADYVSFCRAMRLDLAVEITDGGSA